MFVSLRTISLPANREGECGRLVTALHQAVGSLDGVKSHWIAQPLSAVSLNAGQILWRMTFGSEREAYHAPLLQAWRENIAPLLADTQVTGVGYRVGRSAGNRERAAAVPEIHRNNSQLGTQLGCNRRGSKNLHSRVGAGICVDRWLYRRVHAAPSPLGTGRLVL